MKKFKKCQSCGMPLNKDPKGGGTNSGGAKSNMYCSFCFEDGKFTQPDIMVDEMKALVKKQLKKMGFPGFLGWLAAMGVPKLERWKK